MGAALLAGVLAAGCSPGADDTPVNVIVIGEADALRDTGLRLDVAGQKLRAATDAGLLRFDDNGAVVPDLAESWIVTDDGGSYIFRLRATGSNGKPGLTAAQVRDSLRQTQRDLAGTALGLDLARIAEIRAMTARVVEIRLRSPMPQFLQVLAQPEMSLRGPNIPSGAMRVASIDRARGTAVLRPVPPEQRGLPRLPGGMRRGSELLLRVGRAAEAMRAFDDGRADVVLDGRLSDLPSVDTGPLARGTVRVEAPAGLYGFEVRRARGFLADPDNREAVSLAIDRDALPALFNLEGWRATSTILPPLPPIPGQPAPAIAPTDRWPELDLQEQRNRARTRVAAYKARTGAAPVLQVALPDGPGSERLFAQLARDWGEVGIAARRAPADGPADLVLRDQVARYEHPRWFLNQLACAVYRGPCDPEADRMIARSLDEPDPAVRARVRGEALARIEAANGFIPLGAPIRWSLVRAGFEGFVENALAVHPLPDLAGVPM